MTQSRVGQEKGTLQKIRLIANVIAPDNYDKKFLELREVIFGDLKFPGEEGFDESLHPALSENLNQDNMNTVV